jgi:NADPH:quinone reductase-like Zn-dependent oxidoreductase
MRAIGIRKFGPVDALEYMDVERPSLVPGTVCIRVAAAGINRFDCFIRNGEQSAGQSGEQSAEGKIRFPYVPGAEISGIVEEIGSGVEGFEPGDSVYGLTGATEGGGYAEYATIPEHAIARVPSGISLSEAAALPVAALTAMHGLRSMGHVRHRSRVMVYGASGGVGTLVTRIASILGADVTAVSGRESHEMLRRQGATELLDYEHDDLTSLGRFYDVLFDAVGEFPDGLVSPILRAGGVFLSVSRIPSGKTSPEHETRREAPRTVRQPVPLVSSGAELSLLNPWIESGEMRPVISRTFGWSDAAEGHRFCERGHNGGKLVLIVNADLAARFV